MDVHPAHDLVAQEVRSWYTDWPGRAPGPGGSHPGVDVETRREAFGFVRRGPGPAGRRVVLTIDDPAELPEVLEATSGMLATDAFDIWIDDRRRAAALEDALVSAGFRASDNTIVLALVGELRPTRRIDHPGFRVNEATDDSSLRTWAAVKLQAFSDTEAQPPEKAVNEQVEACGAEWAIARYQLGTLDGVPVSILAHYTASPDQMVFNLATRVPFRHLGIAQSMLHRWTERATSQGARSLLINCDEHGRPADLYRTMGFVDEVYWHRRYSPSPT